MMQTNGLDENNDHGSVWDSELGVWVKEDGQRVVPGTRRGDFPSPLYILGYGSLLWKPGPILEDLESYRCICVDKCRIFGQKSSDHRGTVAFPGLVLTLLDVREMAALPCYSHITRNTGRTLGRVWLIPNNPNMINELIGELDYRESGGYEKVVTTVQLLQTSPCHNEMEFVQALVYTAKPSNPHFFHFKTASINDELSDSISHSQYSALMRICDIVSVAKGPSGRNIDYLLNLVKYLDANELTDPLLSELSTMLKNRVGPSALNDWFQDSDASCSDYNVLGWGSNEHGQLEDTPSSLVDKLVPYAVDLKPPSIPEDTARSISIDDTISSSKVWAVAGGLVSGILHKNRILKLWGHSNPFLQWNILPIEMDQMINDGDCTTRSTATYIADIEGVSINQDHMLLLLRCGTVVEMKLGSSSDSVGTSNTCTVKPEFVVSYPCPHNSIGLTRGSDGVYRFTGSGDERSDKSNRRVLTPLGLKGIKPIKSLKIIKVCAGLRHSIAMTDCGEIFSWGDNRYGQCCGHDILSTVWTHPDKLMFLDISSGARHTVAIDEEGVVWSWGDNRHGALGRTIISGSYDAIPRQVEGLDRTVKWRRVCCGWSHVIVRGVRCDGACVVWGWGRQDMNQLGHRNGNIPKCNYHQPIPLSLPCGEIREIWTGSEYSIAMDCLNRLWSCGWNEHGNLGVGFVSSPIDGSTSNFSLAWSPVLTEGGQVQLNNPWTESVACGGAHVICAS